MVGNSAAKSITTVDQVGSSTLADNESWLKFQGTDYEPDTSTMKSLNQWKDANGANMDTSAEDSSNATQAESATDITHYGYDVWGTQADNRMIDCKTKMQTAQPTLRFIRFWMSTIMNGKNWKYIVTYLQKKEEKVWKIQPNALVSKCLPIYVQIENGEPFKLPEGCLPPQQPKPPTQCEMAYVLGQQVTEQFASMLVEEMVHEAGEDRDEEIKSTTDSFNPDFKENFDSPLVDINNEPVYYDNRSYEIDSSNTNYSQDKFVKIELPNGDVFNTALHESSNYDQCTNSFNNGSIDGQACRTQIEAGVQAWGNYVVLDEVVACTGDCTQSIYVVVSGEQKVRRGWSDNVERAYNSNHRSDQCKASFHMSMDNGLGNADECNYYTTNDSNIVFCPSQAKPYCNMLTSPTTCVVSEPSDHLAVADWTELDTVCSHCRPEPSPNGFHQELNSCYAQNGSFLIPNCTHVNLKLSLIDKLKACFRRELKKGGFTIEKVCLYQSVSRSFKTISEIESFVTNSINHKKCIKYDALGACQKYGYAPRIQLKCPANEVIRHGNMDKEDCFYYYEDARDKHANDELLMKQDDWKKTTELLLKKRIESSTGYSLLKDYNLMMSKATVPGCLMHELVVRTQDKAHQMYQCTTNIVNSDSYACYNYKGVSAFNLCSSYDSNGDCNCYDNSGRTVHVALPGTCEMPVGMDPNCTRVDGDGMCVECGNRVVEFRSDGSFRRCVVEAGEICPLMCATCKHQIGDLEDDESYECLTCAPGYHLVTTGEGDDASTDCTADDDSLVEQYRYNCERWSGEVEGLCAQCLKGYAFDDNDKCVQINIGNGCAAGGEDAACKCMAGFEPEDVTNTNPIHLLPSNLTPNKFSPVDGCKPRAGFENCLLLNDAGDACLYCRTDFY